MERHGRSSGGLRALAAAALVLGATACEAPTFGFPEARSEQGRAALGVWQFAFITAMVVGGLTLGLILWSVFRYRAKDDEHIPRQLEIHVPLEILYTAVPFVIVAVLFGVTFQAERKIERRATADVLQVDVTGFQWQWRFAYPAQGVTLIGAPTAGEVRDPGPTLVLPVGRPVRVVLTSTDVIHAFWVPDFLFKKDNVPGRRNEFDVTVDTPGEYVGRCAEFCGLNHDRMTFRVKAVPADQFDAELARAAQEGAAR
jgi:cytochrome c oxidase subunit II